MATKQVNGLQFVHRPEPNLLPTYIPIKEKPNHIFAGKGQKRKRANELTAMVN